MDRKKRTIMRVSILAVLLAALVFAVYSSLAKGVDDVKIGEQAPNFSLKQLDGTAVKLSDLQGKGVVLNFWGSWCKPCKAEMPALDKKYQELKDKGLVVVGVNISEAPVSVQQFVDQLGVTFPILLDRQSDITRLYNIGPIPTTYFLDSKGIVKDIVIGQMSEATISAKVNKILP